MTTIHLPTGAEEIIQMLEASDHSAYAVGGCVRDCLMGRVAGDWDITTSARPADIKRVFRGRHMIDIGERHGTIAVKAQGAYFEVTTFRIDGAYGDGRRPDAVSFTDDLQTDLSRRDFTINALAYNHKQGLVDYFGGLADVQNGTIRCVGDAAARFDEDYLRILRAYRFSATLGFDIADDVRQAAVEGKQNLRHIAAERIQSEFCKLLSSDNFDKIEDFFDDIGDVLFPEITRLKGYEQDTPYHCYDVYRHTLEVLRHVPNQLYMRLAALFHDVGKFDTRTKDAKGIHHFYGHADVSHKICEAALAGLKFDNATTQRVLAIVKHHDVRMHADKLTLKRRTNKFGAELVRDLLAFQYADDMGKSDMVKTSRLPEVLAATALFEKIAASGEALKISDLAINGADVMRELGISPSAEVGRQLERLMQVVLENPELNEREKLLTILRESKQNSEES